MLWRGATGYFGNKGFRAKWHAPLVDALASMPNLYPPKKRTRPNLESFLVNAGAGLVSVSGRSRMPEARAKARCGGGGLTIYVQKDTPCCYPGATPKADQPCGHYSAGVTFTATSIRCPPEPTITPSIGATSV